jgi:hypothetical protein
MMRFMRQGKPPDLQKAILTATTRGTKLAKMTGMITASSRDMHSVTNKVTQGAIQQVVQLANLKGTRRVYPKATTRVWRLAVRKSRRKPRINSKQSGASAIRKAMMMAMRMVTKRALEDGTTLRGRTDIVKEEVKEIGRGMRGDLTGDWKIVDSALSARPLLQV